MAKKQTQPAQLLKLAEVAKRIGCSKRTARRRIESGDLSAVQEGGMIKVHAWSVDAYLASLQRVGGAR
jgi:excisionase family DNA binding protein